MSISTCSSSATPFVIGVDAAMGCVMTGFEDNIDVGGVSKGWMESVVGIATGCTIVALAGPALSTVSQHETGEAR